MPVSANKNVLRMDSDYLYTWMLKPTSFDIIKLVGTSSLRIDMSILEMKIEL